MTQKQYFNYFELKAEQHTDISGSKKWNLRDLADNLRKKLTGKWMFIDPVENDYEDNSSDGYFKRPNGGFMILAQAKHADTEEQEQVIDECEAIAEEIVRRMRYDSRQYDNLPFLDFNLNTLDTRPIGPIFGDLYGLRVSFELENEFSLEVDADKWSDL